jgi:hypothetical protein
MDQQTFIIDCNICKAKVAAIENGSATRSYWCEEIAEPIGIKLLIGSCPRCKELLVGKSDQVGFKDWQGDEEDEWSDVVRIYPEPPKIFLSFRIPRSARESLSDADRSLRANANMAACIMFGRALEAVCRDILGTKVMLATGVTMLKDKGIIDDRLYNWSQQLRVFRNLAAHPDDDASTISHQDAEDLQSFAYAIIEYIYDLTDRYEEFKARTARARSSGP